MGDFKCDICSKSYPLKGNRDRHMKSHQVAAYSCKRCGQTFKRSDYLLRHKSTCEGGKHQCSKCLKSFSRQDNLNRHQKSCTVNRDMLDVKSKESTKERLRKQTDQYLKKVQLGKEIHDYLMKNTHIREECLTEDLSSALDLYKKQIHV